MLLRLLAWPAPGPTVLIARMIIADTLTQSLPGK